MRSISQYFQKDSKNNSDIINEDQTGFIRGRQAQDNIRKTIHIVNAIQKSGESAILVSMAFYSLSWTF